MAPKKKAKKKATKRSTVINTRVGNYRSNLDVRGVDPAILKQIGADMRRTRPRRMSNRAMAGESRTLSTINAELRRQKRGGRKK